MYHIILYSLSPTTKSVAAISVSNLRTSTNNNKHLTRRRTLLSLLVIKLLSKYYIVMMIVNWWQLGGARVSCYQVPGCHTVVCTLRLRSRYTLTHNTGTSLVSSPQYWPLIGPCSLTPTLTQESCHHLILSAKALSQLVTHHRPEAPQPHHVLRVRPAPGPGQGPGVQCGHRW